jgi:hypothetical protein
VSRGETAGAWSSYSGRGQVVVSQTTGLPELEEMGATAVRPPSCEELGFWGNREVGYDLGWVGHWSSVGLVLLLWASL